MMRTQSGPEGGAWKSEHQGVPATAFANSAFWPATWAASWLGSGSSMGVAPAFRAAAAARFVASAAGCPNCGNASALHDIKKHESPG